jgi:hypothetical protein
MKKYILSFLFITAALPAFATVTISNLNATKNLAADTSVISVVVNMTMTDSVTGVSKTVQGLFNASDFANAAAAKAAIENWGKAQVSAFKNDYIPNLPKVIANTSAVSTATVDTTAIANAP